MHPKSEKHANKSRKNANLEPTWRPMTKSPNSSTALDGTCEPLSVGPSAPNFQEGRVQPRWGRDPRALFTLRASRRGGHELRTSVYPSNFAPIATKLRQRAFQTICKFRFFDAENFFSKKKFGFFFDFHDFRQILEDLVNFGRQNQVPRGILLRMDGFSGPYEAWRRVRGLRPWTFNKRGRLVSVDAEQAWTFNKRRRLI